MTMEPEPEQPRQQQEAKKHQQERLQQERAALQSESLHKHFSPDSPGVVATIEHRHLLDALLTAAENALARSMLEYDDRLGEMRGAFSFIRQGIHDDKMYIFLPPAPEDTEQCSICLRAIVK